MAIVQAIDFGSLVGAQLTALIEAEVLAAEHTSEFIEKVGFERRDDGSLELRTVTFVMPRRDTDGEVHEHRIAIPVLTLVTIPLLSIEEADLEFEARVEQVVTSNVDNESSANGAASSTRPVLRPSVKHTLMTRLARNTKTRTDTRQQDTRTSDIRLSVKIRQSAFPLGIERLLSTADLSVEDETAD
jgi:hypothetical protein